MMMLPQVLSANVYLDGKKLETTPQVIEGRSMLPVREAFENLGLRVDYEEGKVTGTSATHEVIMTIGSENAYVNGNHVTMDTTARIIEGKTMVPLRFVAESLGMVVDWQEPELKEADVQKALFSIKGEYPEGRSWTNDNYYEWKGWTSSGGGYGCAGFAFALSDKAFGTRESRQHTDFDNIRVGDILRINNDSDSVIVTGIEGDKYTMAEGNYNKSVHWGRVFTLSKIKSIADFVITRY